MTGLVTTEGDGLPAGRYAVVPLETWRRIVAELTANPEIFRSVGDVEQWTMTVRGAPQGDEGS